MKRPVLKLAVAMALVTLVSACTIIVEPPVRQPDATRNANDDRDVPVHTFSLNAGSSYLVRIDLDGLSPSALPHLVVEISRDFDLEIYRPNRTRIASSRSGRFFGVGGTGLAPAGVEPSGGPLQQQAILDNWACGGACVVLDRQVDTHSHFYALITNTSGATSSVDLYAFVTTPSDSTEGQNGGMSTVATINTAGGVDQGAIETLGDVDWWRVIGNGWIQFDANDPAIDIRIDLYAANGTTRLVTGIAPGNPFEVFNNEFLVVSSISNRAGAPATSTYHFEGSLTQP